MSSIARSFTYLPASVVVAAALAIALMSPSFVARGATVTYNNPNCTSFTTSGTSANMTVTCVGSGGGGGGGGGAVPACTLSANPTSPAAGTKTTLSASCTNQPTSFTWNDGTGTTGCSGLSNSSSCSVTRRSPGSITFSVTGINTAGSGSPSPQVTVTWQ